MRKFFRYERQKVVLPIILIIWYGVTVGWLMLGAATFDKMACENAQTIFDVLKAVMYENISYRGPADSPAIVSILDQKYSGLGTRSLNLMNENERISNQTIWASASLQALNVLSGGVIFRESDWETFPLDWLWYNTRRCVNNMVCANAGLLSGFLSASQSGTLDDFKLAHSVGKPIAEECTLVAMEEALPEPIGPWLVLAYALYLAILGYIVSSAGLRIHRWYEIGKISGKTRKLRRKS